MSTARRTVPERLLEGILMHGGRIEREEIGQGDFWRSTRIGKTYGTEIKDAYMARDVLRERGEGARLRTRMAFGKRLGFMLGISLGTESLRAALVDANGDLLITREDEASFRRAIARPEQLLEDIAVVARTVLETALGRSELLLAGREGPYLPLLGVAVAWPTPLHRLTKLPTGNALHPDWMTGDSLPSRVAARLGLRADRSSAVNDANGSAISAVFDECRADDPLTDVHRGWVSLVLRLGGGVGAGTILVDKSDGTRSGFTWSQLVEGTQGLAGELGHLAIPRGIVTELNKKRNRGLAPLDAEAECSCGSSGHLEGVAGVAALVQRIEASPALDAEDLGLLAGSQREGPPRMQDVVARLRGSAAKSALQDIGQLVGHSLSAPILMLNPRRITLTGSLAHTHVEDGIRMARAAWSSFVSDDPELRLLEEDGNRYSAARGAAMVVFREKVFRCFREVARNAGYVDVIEFRAANLPTVGLTIGSHMTAAERTRGRQRGRRGPKAA